VLRTFFLINLIVCIGFASSVFALEPGDEITLSFLDAKLQNNERIVGFEINVTTGNIVAVGSIPEDWSLDLQPEISSKTKVSGSSRHGAGALFTTSELPTLTIRVKKPVGGSAPKFSVKATILVTAEFEKTHTIELKQTELVFRKKGI